VIAHNPALRDPRGGLDFLGPEFLTWLWWRAAEAPRFVHADGTEVFGHFDEHLEFRGERSAARRTVLRAGMPGGSAEARAALRSGKTLVSARLLLVRGEEERRVTLRAEDLDFSGLKTPSPEGEGARERLEASLDALDRAQDDLDLCFLTFLDVRCGPDWSAEVRRLRAWGARPSEDDRVAGTPVGEVSTAVPRSTS
jgi:hypothetical protein